MTAPDRRQAKDDALRGRILDAAEEIFAREGADRVTMRRIAAAVGYAPPVLYRLFADKADLMDHLITRGYAGVRARYAAVLAEPGGTAMETLGDLLRAYAEYALEHPDHYRMWFESGVLRLADGVMTMGHGRLSYVVFQAWLDGIDACRGEGRFTGRETLDVFQGIWAVVHGAISLRLQHPDFPWRPLEEHLHEALAE